jgi:hypothetical protein
MEEKNAAMETDSLKEHDFRVCDLRTANDEENLAIFSLVSGGLWVSNCRCFYTLWGDFKFELPHSAGLTEDAPEGAPLPYPRIQKILLAEIERIKVKRFDEIPF